jgi:hypothetical protein
MVAVYGALVLVALVAGIVSTVVFDLPEKARRVWLKWRGLWPIAVRLEWPDIKRVYPSQSIDFRDDPQHEGARSVVLHLFNHSPGDRHVVLNDESEVLGVKSARIAPAAGFWIPSQESVNAVFTLLAPRQSWASAPVVRLKLRARTNADEKIWWRGNVTPLPYDSGAPPVAWGPPPFSGGWS